MCENENKAHLEPKYLGELFERNYIFSVPAYQRGYRWEESQVKDLLNDIFKFNIRNFEKAKGYTTKEFENDKTIISDKDQEYCLQPVVVKRLNENEFELIDGQQRLTTLYLIALKAREKDDYNLGKEDEDGNIDTSCWYTLKYPSRPATTKLIESLKTNFKDYVKLDAEDIDSYYIIKACETIDEWFKENIVSTKANTKWYLHFKENFKDYVKIIWYETNEENPIAVFRRLNTGKIRLEDSELIKALFLKDSGCDVKYTEKKKFRIASEWDYIEKDLQNDSFWHFLSVNKEKKDNRIELIFDIIRKKDKEAAKEEEAKKWEPGAEEHLTYRYFFYKLSNSSEGENAQDKQSAENANHSERTSIQEELWEKEVIEVFYTLKGWYNDIDIYHLIGFLINTKTCDISEIYNNLYQNKKDKNKFKNGLKQRIYDKYLTVIEDKTKKELDLKEDISYNPDDDSKHPDKIRPILLLHNILTCMENKESAYKFPFDKYLNESWDIEHISPAHISKGIDINKRKDWYKEHKKYIDTTGDDELISKINDYQSNEWKNDGKSDDKSDKFNEEILGKVVEKFNKLDESDKWSLANLALLNSDINRSYGNALFPVKRDEIITKDMESKFVPVCTKNAFLGYYSMLNNKDDNKGNTDDSSIYYWTDQKAGGYFQDIKDKIGNLCEEVNRV